MLSLYPAFLFVTAAALAAPPSGSVSGTVLNDANRQPVRKAAVILTSTARDRSFAVAITDGAGHFTIAELPAGAYTIHATHSGFFSVNYGALKPQRPGVLLKLAAAEQRTALTLHLVPSQSISGTVLDAEGDPLPGVQVNLYTRHLDRGKPRYQRTIGSLTDGAGHYQLSGQLLSGEYWAVAQSRFAPSLRTHPVAIAGEKLPPETIAPQFYSHADRLEAATPIVLSPGGDRANVDFQLNYVPQVGIHGTVSGIPEGARNATLRLDPATLPTGVQFDGAQHAIDPAHPNFAIMGLVPGAYRMALQAGSRRFLSTIQLSALNTEMNVTLEPGTSLAGSVMVEGPNAESLKNLRVNLSPGEPGNPQPPLQAGVKAGQFSFPEVPAGTWDINVSPIPRGSYIKSMLLGKQDVLLEDMEIGPNTKGPLTIVVSTAAPKVEGTVEPAGPATVLAAPTGKLAQIFSFYATAQADEKGHFTFQGLNPGTYRFYAFQDLEPEAWQNPAFLLLFETQSKSAELKEGATETVTLPVIGTTTP